MARLGSAAFGILIFAVAWAAGVGLMRPADAAAGDLVVIDGDGTVATSLSVDRLYPGGPSTSKRYVVGLGSSSYPATMGMLLDNLEDLERGCNHPEQRADDTTCDDSDPTHGELSSQLEVTVTADAVGTASKCPATLGDPTVVLGPMVLRDAVALGAVPLGGAALSPGDTRCVELTIELPWEADNLVQSDLARFDLVFGAEQHVPPSGDIEPVALDGPTTEGSGDGPPTGPLLDEVQVLPRVIERGPVRATDAVTRREGSVASAQIGRIRPAGLAATGAWAAGLLAGGVMTIGSGVALARRRHTTDDG